MVFSPHINAISSSIFVSSCSCTAFIQCCAGVMQVQPGRNERKNIDHPEVILGNLCPNACPLSGAHSRNPGFQELLLRPVAPSCRTYAYHSQGILK